MELFLLLLNKIFEAYDGNLKQLIHVLVHGGVNVDDNFHRLAVCLLELMLRWRLLIGIYIS